MARQVGYTPFEALKWEQALTDFAELVAEAEREECAKVCDELSKKHSWEGCYANECAEAIRARGTNE
jgi:sugar phosphate isomerase/epimerase